jgi:HSP20 family protein
LAFCLKKNDKKKEVFMTTSIIKRNNGSTSLPARTLSGWVDQLLNENLNRFFNDDFWGFRGIDQQVNVPVNLRETDKTYEMSLVAPGLRKEDFKLSVTNDLLTVAYEHKEEQNQENKQEGWLRKEYRMQSFSRSFTLDDTVDISKITASYDNGILHLSLPKKENAQRLSRNIEVK